MAPAGKPGPRDTSLIPAKNVPIDNFPPWEDLNMHYTPLARFPSAPLLLCLGIGLLVRSAPGQSSAVVPGTGTHIDFVGDSFETGEWGFIHNSPKSSRENDEQTRFPNGRSTNGRWFEGPERGQPDSIKRVPTPEGGLSGSQFALSLRTLNSGIPGQSNRKVEQDDLIVDCVSRVGTIPVAEIPNVVTRVYLPPADQWENRSGPHFGFRGTLTTTTWKEEEQRGFGRFGSRGKSVKGLEPYWPGIWVHFQSKTDSKVAEDAAFLTVRGNRLGRDFKVRDISQDEFGWWTLGMSFTGDGMVHYYASPGVDDLTESDYLTSQFPYQYRAERFETMFFNVCNLNDGRSWSTPFVVDDPQLFVVRSERVQAVVQHKLRLMEQRTAQRQARQATPNTSGRRGR